MTATTDPFADLRERVKARQDGHAAQPSNDYLDALKDYEAYQRRRDSKQKDRQGADDSAPWPALDQAAFHGLAGEVVQAIDPHTEADPAAVLVNILIYFGSAVGRAPHALVGSKRHGLNLMAVHVGETSKGRKGTSMAEVDALYERIDEDWHDTRILSGLASGEGLTYAVRDASDKKDKDGLPVDEGVGDKRLLIVEEEFASVLKVASREGNTLSPVIRQAWDNGTLRNLTKNTPLKATGAHVSIIGHITIGELRRYLTETESGNGFANRFLWVCSRRSKELPDGGGIPSYGGIITRLHDALMFARSCTLPIARDGEARDIWHAVYGPLSAGKPGLLGAVTSRAEAQVLRLSTLYAAMDCSDVVRPPHLMAALALWEYAEQSALYIFGEATGDSVADRIMAALKAAGAEGLDTTALYRLFAGHVSAARREAALRELEDAGRITKRHETTDGRDRIVYVAV